MAALKKACTNHGINTLPADTLKQAQVTQASKPDCPQSLELTGLGKTL
jgi:hypothetical protein